MLSARNSEVTNGTERRTAGARERPSTATTTAPMKSRISGAMIVSFAVMTSVEASVVMREMEAKVVIRKVQFRTEISGISP